MDRFAARRNGIRRRNPECESDKEEVDGNLIGGAGLFGGWARVKPGDCMEGPTRSFGR